MDKVTHERPQEPHPMSQTPIVPLHEPEQIVQQTPARPFLVQRARSDPHTLSRTEVQLLQRTIGNQAVAQLFQTTAQRVAGVPAADPAARKGNTTGLPASLKAGVEYLSGFSLDDVPRPLQDT